MTKTSLCPTNSASLEAMLPAQSKQSSVLSILDSTHGTFFHSSSNRSLHHCSQIQFCYNRKYGMCLHSTGNHGKSEPELMLALVRMPSRLGIDSPSCPCTVELEAAEGKKSWWSHLSLTGCENRLSIVVWSDFDPGKKTSLVATATHRPEARTDGRTWSSSEIVCSNSAARSMAAIQA